MSVSPSSLWGIILAGGEGERLKRFVREQVGLAILKQSYALVTGSPCYCLSPSH
jgi:hypothetical protein